MSFRKIDTQQKFNFVSELVEDLIRGKPSLDRLLHSEDPSYNGHIFQLISELSIMTKCIDIYDTFYHYDSSLKRGDVKDKWIPMKSFCQLLGRPIYSGPDGGVDIMIEEDGKKIFYQVKHSQHLSFEDAGIR